MRFCRLIVHGMPHGFKVVGQRGWHVAVEYDVGGVGISGE